MKSKEQKWIRAILHRGEQEAADKLVRAYYDEIYVYVYRQVGNKEDAMDLTQEGFIAALQSLHTYDAKKSSFRTWLYHVVSYKVIDARRKVRLDTLPIEEIEVSDMTDFTEAVNNQELLNKIEAYIREFEPDIQEIFRLHLYGEQSFPEIAQATGQPEAKIKAQYYRLLQKVRKEFSKYDE